MKWQASWIWHGQKEYRQYNDTIIARRRFQLKQEPRQAIIRITADSRYRLIINNEWVNDGPSRCWPQHFQYDEIEITGFLRPGQNEILVIARFFGVGTFHQIPQEAGLLAQLDIKTQAGTRQRLVTDSKWETARATVWDRRVPKISIQQGPAECYDARLAEEISFAPAVERYPAGKGPWRNLNPRDVALLTRQPVHFRGLHELNVVANDGKQFFCLPIFRLVNPGSVSASYYPSAACGTATIVRSPLRQTVQIKAVGLRVWVNGAPGDAGCYGLQKGDNLLVAFTDKPISHERSATLVFEAQKSLTFGNPLDSDHENGWAFIRWPEQADGDSGRWMHGEESKKFIEEYEAACKDYGSQIREVKTLHEQLGKYLECLPSETMFVDTANLEFNQRKRVPNALPKVEDPGALIYDTPEFTTVHPSGEGDVELCYDLGEQCVGYYDFEILADAGVTVDCFQVEYISPAGRVQHTGTTCNGLRYITRQGVNRFTSMQRRSGRYVFLTLRNLQKPLRIRLLQVIASTYPVNRMAAFDCSDARLRQVWDISIRTLQLCMEDTFTDCPLYEQTFWVGDARNEALYAYDAFGAEDLARRSIRLAGQSLERQPLVGSQVPSAWDITLPAWSFLWGVAVWEYYFFSGDRHFLQETWSKVKRNLQRARDCCTDHHLFRGPFWNFFDWTPIDQGQYTVLHNSMLLVGALDAADKCATALSDQAFKGWITEFRTDLVAAINRCWDPARKAYPDALLPGAKPSGSRCVHTHFLALLYNIAEGEQRQACWQNVLQPPDDMVPVGSPFAAMFLYETMEAGGEYQRILDAIHEHYLPMLQAGATTVWETFPAKEPDPTKSLTRSHCHAWSAAPIYFLNRIVLGIRQIEPGGMVYEISPFLAQLEWAAGTVVTAQGPLQVSWTRTANELHINVRAPRKCRCYFRKNPSHEGLTLKLDGDCNPE